MKIATKLFVGATVIVSFAGSVLFIPTTSESSRREVNMENPEEPYEDFILQRTYPNSTFEINTYRQALNDAAERAVMERNSQSTASVSWQLEGPGNIGGRFNCLAVDPTNSTIMYAGSANGGVWKTIDDGATWSPITDALPYSAIGAIAINPNNSNEIWIGTGDVNISGTMYAGNGVYKSTDAGLTWTYLGLSNTYVVSSIVFNSANTNEVLIGTMGNAFNRDNNRGMYRTANSGVTFTNTLFLNDSTGVIDMVQHPSQPSTVYCSSFSRIRTDRESLLFGTEVYVYKSTDFGQTWSVLSGGLPNGNTHQRLGIAISASSPNTLYALYSTSDGSTYPELYKTTNGGTSWSPVNISSFDMSAYGAFGWYFGKIYVDPNNANNLFIPGVDLQGSTDGGLNWNMITPPWWLYEVHADGHFLHFNSSNDMIYCTDGGMNRTYDGGTNWIDIENIPVNQFYAVTENPHNLGQYAGGVQDNGTMYGNASVINNFTRIYGGDGFTVQYDPNPSLLYTETQYGNIVFDDAFPTGNWQSIDMDPNQSYNWHTPYFTSKHSSSTLFYGGQQVMRIDGSPYGAALAISPSLVDPQSPWRVKYITTIHQSDLDSNILYAGTADGRVWNSLDYGSTWSNVSPFQSSTYYVTRVMTSPNNSSTAYVTRSGYRANDNTPLIFKTIDNGSTWANISGNLPALAVNDILIAQGDENSIFIANDAGVYYTTDGGVNWSRLGNDLPFVAVLDIHFNHNQSRLIAGTFGRSIYSIDLQTITGVASVNSVSEVNVYPNPSTDWCTFSAETTVISVELYSLSGSLVKSESGSRISVSELPAGVYFAEVHMVNGMVRKRVVVR